MPKAASHKTPNATTKRMRELLASAAAMQTRQRAEVTPVAEHAGPPWTVREFCGVARITVTHGYTLIREGALPAVELGASKRIPSPTAARFLGVSLTDAERLRQEWVRNQQMLAPLENSAD